MLLCIAGYLPPDQDGAAEVAALGEGDQDVLPRAFTAASITVDTSSSRRQSHAHSGGRPGTPDSDGFGFSEFEGIEPLVPPQQQQHLPTQHQHSMARAGSVGQQQLWRRSNRNIPDPAAVGDEGMVTGTGGPGAQHSSRSNSNNSRAPAYMYRMSSGMLANSLIEGAMDPAQQEVEEQAGRQWPGQLHRQGSEGATNHSARSSREASRRASSPGRASSPVGDDSRKSGTGETSGPAAAFSRIGSIRHAAAAVAAAAESFVGYALGGPGCPEEEEQLLGEAEADEAAGEESEVVVEGEDDQALTPPVWGGDYADGDKPGYMESFVTEGPGLLRRIPILADVCSTSSSVDFPMAKSTNLFSASPLFGTPGAGNAGADGQAVAAYQALVAYDDQAPGAAAAIAASSSKQLDSGGFCLTPQELLKKGLGHIPAQEDSSLWGSGTSLNKLTGGSPDTGGYFGFGEKAGVEDGSPRGVAALGGLLSRGASRLSREVPPAQHQQQGADAGSCSSMSSCSGRKPGQVSIHEITPVEDDEAADRQQRQQLSRFGSQQGRLQRQSLEGRAMSVEGAAGGTGSEAVAAIAAAGAVALASAALAPTRNAAEGPEKGAAASASGGPPASAPAARSSIDGLPPPPSYAESVGADADDEGMLGEPGYRRVVASPEVARMSLGAFGGETAASRVRNGAMLEGGAYGMYRAASGAGVVGIGGVSRTASQRGPAGENELMMVALPSFHYEDDDHQPLVAHQKGMSYTIGHVSGWTVGECSRMENGDMCAVGCMRETGC